ncbi:MAG TPA: hopanoid-associated sugar epimerase [Stellaceae bacterium]|nr:hopanoid-associated sugar epimerase [Stellaceae bacterium]
MTILVTGATGFLGSAVARCLLASGARVRVLARAGSDRRNIDGLDIETAIGSLDAPETLRPALEGCAGLYHVAADYRLWVPEPAAMYRTNVEGTRALMEAALDAGVERVVHTSSVATLGLLPGGVSADEATLVTLADMIGPYKRSKFLSEEVVKTLVRERGLPAVIVNPSTPVGPRDIKPTPTGRMIVEAATGRMPAFVDTGLNFGHVDDIAAGHLLAFERGRVGERYILGGENLTLRQVLAEIARLVNRRPPTVRLPVDLLMPLAFGAEAVARLTGKEPFVTVDGLRLARKKMFFSIDKARNELGYAPRPANAGFADAVAWFGENGYLTAPV